MGVRVKLSRPTRSRPWEANYRYFQKGDEAGTLTRRSNSVHKTRELAIARLNDMIRYHSSAGERIVSAYVKFHEL